MRVRRIVTLFAWLFWAAVLGTIAMACGAAHAEETLIHFSSGNCPPCREMRPIVDAMKADGYAVQCVDVDQQPSVARQYGISAVPCFILVEHGKEKARWVGRTDRDRLERMFSQKIASGQRQAADAPTPAWRYVEPRGHFAAVVRIDAQEAAGQRSVGSGVVVKWRRRIVILTARHVVADAKRIVVETWRKSHYAANVVSIDKLWDCAVLEFADATPEGIDAAELAFGDEAMQTAGSRLETCGYGSDNRLACNSGLFIGYKRSATAMQGPDDWMMVSGRARQGDSGGPVFNANGHVVGVLWGCSAESNEVACVQAGRLHLLLSAAIGDRIEPRAFRTATHAPAGCVRILVCIAYPPRSTAAAVSIEPRHPTPAMRQPNMAQPPATADAHPNSSEVASPTGVQVAVDPPRVLPYRSNEDRRNADTDARLAEMARIMAEQQKRMQAAQPQPPSVAASEPEKKVASPLAAGLCVLGAVILGIVVYFAATKND